MDIVTCVHCALCTLDLDMNLFGSSTGRSLTRFFFQYRNNACGICSSLVYVSSRSNLYSFCNWSDLISNKWRFTRPSAQFNGLSFSWHSKWIFEFLFCVSCSDKFNLDIDQQWIHSISTEMLMSSFYKRLANEHKLLEIGLCIDWRIDLLFFSSDLIIPRSVETN